jgi:hypothetical protein
MYINEKLVRMLRRIYFKIAACICITAASHSAFAQLRDVNLYMHSGGGLGSTNTLNIGGTLMYKRWAATYDYVYQFKQGDNVPSDYHEGFIILGPATPQQILKGHCIEGAHVIYFANGTLRFLARGGIFFGTYEAPQNFIQITGPWVGFLGSANYNYDWQTTGVTGLVLHPTIEWPCTAPFGGSAGIRIVITAPKTTATMNFNILLGKVRKSRNKSSIEQRN